VKGAFDNEVCGEPTSGFSNDSSNRSEIGKILVCEVTILVFGKGSGF
jgi:hypothetical protein